jgi:hypothetical protein
LSITPKIISKNKKKSLQHDIWLLGCRNHPKLEINEGVGGRGLRNGYQLNNQKKTHNNEG